MTIDIRTAYRAWASYSGSGPGTRIFLAARLGVVPIGAMDEELRGLSGRVMSLGCGYGLVERYLAMLNHDVQVDGFELDESRVETANATTPDGLPITVLHQDVTTIETGRQYDAALALDVMHHVPGDAHRDVAEALWRAVRPGGTCLVKDIDTTPRWKHAWNRLHDRIVAGPDPISCRSMRDMQTVFEAAGFTCEAARRLHPFSPYPHYLLVLNRPAG